MPERADVIFRHRFPEDARAIVNVITQRALPHPQQTNSKRDQPSRKPAFDLQLFLRDVFADPFCSLQRYAPWLGNPIWSRMRQTTVSTTAARNWDDCRRRELRGE